MRPPARCRGSPRALACALAGRGHPAAAGAGVLRHRTAAAWEAGVPAGTALPRLASLSPAGIGHAWIAAPTAAPPTPRPTPLTPGQVERAGCARPAGQRTCPPDPLPRGNRLHLEAARGYWSLARHPVGPTGLDYTPSASDVTIGGLGQDLAELASPGLAGFLRHGH